MVLARVELIVIAACLCGAIVCGCEKPASLATYQAVVADIKSGRQTVAPTGEIILPPAQASSVVDGKAYATTQLAGTMLVLFPTWRGKAWNLRGYLYSGGPPLAVGSEISINVPLVDQMLQPETAEVTIERAVAPGWYYVSRTLD
jgi:hypothetical protein